MLADVLIIFACLNFNTIKLPSTQLYLHLLFIFWDIVSDFYISTYNHANRIVEQIIKTESKNETKTNWTQTYSLTLILNWVVSNSSLISESNSMSK